MTDHSPDHAERAREVAHRIVLEFRPDGWPAKEDELARLLLNTFADPAAALSGRDAVGEALEKIAAFESQPIRGTVSEQSASLGWNRAGEWAARVAASALATRAALHDTTVRENNERKEPPHAGE